MTSTHVFRQQVHVVHFIRTLAALREAWESRVHTVPPDPPFPERLQARCIQCGIALSREELAWLLQHGIAPPAPHARLQRIQHGYCARRTCDSYFYDLTIETDDAAQAECLEQAAQSAGGAVYSGTREEASGWRSGLWSSCCKPEVLVGFGAVAVLAFMLWWNYRTPSWAALPTGAKYQADGSSIPAVLRDPAH